MGSSLYSSQATSGAIAAGVFNLTSPAPAVGQGCALQMDSAGNLLVNVAVGGGGGGGGTQYVDGVTQATPTGTVALGKNPSNVLHSLSLDSSGNLNVNLASGTITGGNAAAGLTGSPVPTSADYVGYNSGGNLIGVSSGTPLPVAQQGNVNVTQGTSPWVVSGTVTANQGGAPWSQNLTQVAGVSLGATAVTNFGTAPAATAVPGTNASIYAGTTGITATSSSLNVNVTNTVPVTLTSTTVTGTVAVTQSTSPWVVSLASTTITGTVAVTQSTSPWTIQGDSASGAAKAGNPVQTGGVFNTTQPTVTTGQTVEAQSTARGALIVATGVDPFTVAVSGTVGVTQSTSPWVVSLASTTITGTVAVTQSTSPWTIQGDSASGAAKAGNPVQVGGVFNTTQPTVTTGQTVEGQYTARGAQIVAVGVDGFAVTVGGTVAVTQSTSPWVVSLASTTITGTVAVTQSTNPWTIQGDSASGAAKAGNPVQMGGVFNTTQPTVTTGQTVESQSTARGATIVATGADLFVVSTKTPLNPSSPTSASVGVSSGLALASNANRKGLHLVNTSSASISLGFGSSAVLNSGITLTPNGTFWMDEDSFSTAAVNAIASAAASNLAIQEYA